MGKFYIETSSSSVANGSRVIYELTATTDVSVSKTSKLTNYPVQSGAEFTDNIVVDNGTITLSGIISDVAFTEVSSFTTSTGVTLPDSNVGIVEQYITQLSKRIDNKESFTFYFSNILQPLKDCVITSFTFSKNNKLGGESWEVKITAKPVRFSSRARFVLEPLSNWSALLAKKDQGTGNKSTLTDTQKSKASAQVNRGLLSPRRPESLLDYQP